MFNSTLNPFYEIDLPQNKCCHMGYSFDDNYQCIQIPNNTYKFEENVTNLMAFTCPEDFSLVFNFALDNLTSSICSDLLLNGTEIFADCLKNKPRKSGSITAIRMWGTQTYMTTNIAHVILCAIIIAIYSVVPELSKSVYNRAVLRHYISLMCLGISLSTIGYINLYDLSVNNTLLCCIWLTLQYFTLSTVFWLNVICYDMTLVITRFEWMRSNYDDNRKLLIYGLIAWGGALSPVLFAATFEFMPGLPSDFVLKPKYMAYRGERRWIVNYYFFFLPTLTLLCNNALFIYTTYKVIRINRSTEIVRSQTTTVEKNYLVFLKLYLLMGAPWFFGCLFAFVFNELIVLKFCRVLQPALWLVILIIDKKLRTKILEKICSIKRIVR